METYVPIKIVIQTMNTKIDKNRQLGRNRNARIDGQRTI